MICLSQESSWHQEDTAADLVWHRSLWSAVFSWCQQGIEGNPCPQGLHGACPWHVPKHVQLYPRPWDHGLVQTYLWFERRSWSRTVAPAAAAEQQQLTVQRPPKCAAAPRKVHLSGWCVPVGGAHPERALFSSFRRLRVHEWWPFGLSTCEPHLDSIPCERTWGHRAEQSHGGLETFRNPKGHAV